MNNQIITYYIQENPTVLSGSIYTFYLNKNTKLNLTSVIYAKNLHLQDLLQNNTDQNVIEMITISN